MRVIVHNKKKILRWSAAEFASRAPFPQQRMDLPRDGAFAVERIQKKQRRLVDSGGPVAGRAAGRVPAVERIRQPGRSQSGDEVAQNLQRPRVAAVIGDMMRDGEFEGSIARSAFRVGPGGQQNADRRGVKVFRRQRQRRASVRVDGVRIRAPSQQFADILRRRFGASA